MQCVMLFITPDPLACCELKYYSRPHNEQSGVPGAPICSLN